MTKENFKQIIYLALIIIWMLTIFLFSNENGNDSQKTSRIITDKIVQVLTYNQDITEEQELNLIENVNYIVRKFAHFSIYVLGGILIYNYIDTLNLKANRKIIVPIIIGALYASFDELHQYFVDGRSAQILDICIDSLGVITGVILTDLIKRNN